jgi:GH43 family beta-xylosidase
VSGPAWDGYLADPFVLRLPDGGYAAYGSGPPAASQPSDDRVFQALWSPDLRTWHERGRVLHRLPPEEGDEYWAPEVAVVGGAYWMYYSVGRGIDGHGVRVARADAPFGPFTDTGVRLTPGERFAIDAHPFRDDDGRWYLFYARDVLDHPRPGTHLAVVPLARPDAVAGPPVEVLAPFADWQLYERDRAMYGRRFDWYTLEGPFVVRRLGRYWLTFSGGAWTGPGYAVSWAVADHPLGPWTPAPDGDAPLLRTGDGLVGPGHDSVVVGPDGADIIAFHSWDAGRTRRQMRLRRFEVTASGPLIGSPLARA